MNFLKTNNAVSLSSPSPRQLTVSSSNDSRNNVESGKNDKRIDPLTKDDNNLNQFWHKIKDSIDRHFKFLTGIFVSAFVLTVIILIILVNRSHRDATICLSSACIDSATTSIKYLDSSIDPCTDFYTFACGKYINELDDLQNVTHKSTFTILREVTLKQIKSLIKQPLSKNASKAYATFNKLYNICMNDTLNTTAQIEHAKLILKTITKWPMLTKSWKDTDYDLIEITKKLRQLGIPFNFFFKLNVGVNELNTSQYGLEMSLNQQATFKGAHFENLLKVVENTSEVQKDIQEVKKMMEKFKEVYNSTQQLSAIAFSISYLQETTGFNWLEYVKNAISVPDIPITPKDVVTIRNYERLTNITNLIRDAPKRAQANYVFLWILSWMMPHLTKMKSSFGSSRVCLPIVSKSMYLVLNSLYVKKYFDANTSLEIRELVFNLREEFMKILKTVDWLDEPTRISAVEKLNSMTMCVGYPKELLDDNNVDEFYKTLEVNFTNYLNAFLSVNRFNVDQIYKRLRTSIDTCYWIDDSRHITIVNAFYLLLHNKIMLPAAFLQSLLYDTKRPHYINYAITGMIIGHEMTHGFDHEGKDFDKNGKPNDWWSRQSLQEFHKRSKCIVDQYNRYLIPKLNQFVNGELTQGENIADNGGLKQSYFAYLSWVKRHNPEKALPGLKYTANQLFWISFAQFWCSYDGLDYLKLVAADPHPPSRVRVIGTLSNSESFSKDFNCPLGSPMNPPEKCSVW